MVANVGLNLIEHQSAENENLGLNLIEHQSLGRIFPNHIWRFLPFAILSSFKKNNNNINRENRKKDLPENLLMFGDESQEKNKGQTDRQKQISKK